MTSSGEGKKAYARPRGKGAFSIIYDAMRKRQLLLRNVNRRGVLNGSRTSFNLSSCHIYWRDIDTFFM